MEDLICAGKILYWGVSEWPAEMMVEANAIARQLGARPIAGRTPGMRRATSRSWWYRLPLETKDART